MSVPNDEYDNLSYGYRFLTKGPGVAPEGQRMPVLVLNALPCAGQGCDLDAVNDREGLRAQRPDTRVVRQARCRRAEYAERLSVRGQVQDLAVGEGNDVEGAVGRGGDAGDRPEVRGDDARVGCGRERRRLLQARHVLCLDDRAAGCDPDDPAQLSLRQRGAEFRRAAGAIGGVRCVSDRC